MSSTCGLGWNWFPTDVQIMQLYSVRNPSSLLENTQVRSLMILRCTESQVSWEEMCRIGMASSYFTGSIDVRASRSWHLPDLILILFYLKNIYIFDMWYWRIFKLKGSELLSGNFFLICRYKTKDRSLLKYLPYPRGYDQVYDLRSTIKSEKRILANISTRKGLIYSIISKINSGYFS